MRKNKIRKICASPFWFLIGSIIFIIGGIRFLLIEDSTGGIIYLSAALLFLIGFIGQIKFNKRR